MLWTSTLVLLVFTGKKNNIFPVLRFFFHQTLEAWNCIYHNNGKLFWKCVLSLCKCAYFWALHLLETSSSQPPPCLLSILLMTTIYHHPLKCRQDGVHPQHVSRWQSYLVLYFHFLTSYHKAYQEPCTLIWYPFSYCTSYMSTGEALSFL